MRAASSCLLVMTSILAGVGAARAEEAPPPTPAERTARVLADVDAKGRARRFLFDGVLVVNGTELGPIQMSVEPAPEGSGAAFLAVDELRVGEGDGGVHVRQEARLGPRLEALDGRTTSRMDGEPTLEITWKRDGAGYAFTRKEGSAEPTTFRVESEAPRSATMAATVFFATSTPALPAKYALETLVVEPRVGDDATGRARTLTLEVVAPEAVLVAGEARTLPVVRVERAGEPDALVLLALTDDRQGLVQLEQAERGAVMRAAAPKKEPFDFTKPPTTPQGAALVAARALAVADVDALDRLIDWAEVDPMLAKISGLGALGPANRRKFVLDDLRKRLQANPPGLIEATLRAAESQLEVKDLGEGRAQVTFPPVFKSLQLMVRKVGDVWKLAELPG